MDEVKLKEYLIQHDERFRQLAEKHRGYEKELETLVGQSYLKEADQIRETIIKKKKLALKDQMHFLMSRYRQEHASA